jgi:hypothetical protein
MPLPPAHLDSLERHMRLHRQRIAELRRLLDMVDREITRPQAGPGNGPKPERTRGLTAKAELLGREIRTHEELLALGQDERLLNALGELLDDPELARAASGDPRGYARERGLELPRNMNLTLRFHNGQIELLIAFYDNFAPFLLLWNNDGFSPPHGEQEIIPQPGGTLPPETGDHPESPA